MLYRSQRVRQDHYNNSCQYRIPTRNNLFERFSSIVLLYREEIQTHLFQFDEYFFGKAQYTFQKILSLLCRCFSARCIHRLRKRQKFRLLQKVREKYHVSATFIK